MFYLVLHLYTSCLIVNAANETLSSPLIDDGKTEQRKPLVLMQKYHAKTEKTDKTHLLTAVNINLALTKLVLGVKEEESKAPFQSTVGDTASSR